MISFTKTDSAYSNKRLCSMESYFSIQCLPIHPFILRVFGQESFGGVLESKGSDQAVQCLTWICKSN